ncbi:MAG: nucleotidyltransferase family protein [Nitrososphaerales archaeon]|nr:nucleotidyltransferase family protein [Nitrososphaerales archaeon]
MISGLILAAGASRRMGAPKQSMNIAGKPMLQYAVDAFKDSRLGEVVLVVRAGLLWKPAAVGRLRVVFNPHPEEGISSSLRLGLTSINSRSEAVVIGLGDKPLLLPSTIRGLVSAYRESGSRIIIPTYEGMRGNPILLRKTLYGEMLRLRGDTGAKSVIKRHAESVLEVPVTDEGVLVDVNTPADIRAAERLLAARERLAAEGKSRK